MCEPKGFYYYFRPLALLGKIMCSFPIENVLSSDPFKLRHTRFSLTFAYSFAIQYSLVSFVMINCVPHIKTGSLAKTFLVSLTICMVIRSNVSFTLNLFTHAKRMPRLIQLLHVFEDRWKKRREVQQSHWQNFFLRVVCTSVGYFILISLHSYGTIVALNEISPDLDLHGPKLLMTFLIGLLGSWYIAPMFYFIYFSSAICNGFRCINDALFAATTRKKYDNLFENTDSMGMEEFAENITELRFLHSMLAEATVELGKCFGTFLAIEKLFNVVAIVGNLSCFIHDSTHSVYLIILTVVNHFFGTTIASLGERIKRRVSIHCHDLE